MSDWHTKTDHIHGKRIVPIKGASKTIVTDGSIYMSEDDVSRLRTQIIDHQWRRDHLHKRDVEDLVRGDTMVKYDLAECIMCARLMEPLTKQVQICQRCHGGEPRE